MLSVIICLKAMSWYTWMYVCIHTYVWYWSYSNKVVPLSSSVEAVVKCPSWALALWLRVIKTCCKACRWGLLPAYHWPSSLPVGGFPDCRKAMRWVETWGMGKKRSRMGGGWGGVILGDGVGQDWRSMVPLNPKFHVCMAQHGTPRFCAG